MFKNVKFPTLDEPIDKFDPSPLVVMVPLLFKVVTVKLLPPTANVPAVSVNVVAVMSPPAVNVPPDLFKVKVEYVASGMVLVSVKVQAPLEALGIVTVPVVTVIVPELVNVVETVKSLAATTKVPDDKVNVDAVVLPCKVPPLDNINVPYVLAGKLDAVLENVKLPTLDEPIARLEPSPLVVIVPLLFKVVTVKSLPATTKVPADKINVVAVRLPPNVPPSANVKVP